METFAGLPVHQFETPKQWRAWLDKHHTQTTGVWLKIAKKSTGITTVTHLEALDEALCYGWIDGQGHGLDEQYYLQKFTPRRPKSIWSKINVAKVASLTAAGKMRPAGLAAVSAAKAEGRWARAYDSHSTSTVPADFQAALDNNPRAKEFFATLNKTNVYAFLWRIQTAKKPETRQARIEKFITMLSKGEKLH